MAIRILKTNGERVEFRPEKIAATLRRAGARNDTIEHVLAKVTPRIKEGMATRRVLAIVRKELRKENRCISHRYNLRAGLLRLGPAGFKFEQYIASVLTAYGYQAIVPPHDIPGLCVSHEVDVVAVKDKHRIMIEAKFRNRFEDTVTLKDAMSTWARFRDLKDGAKAGRGKDFDEAWIVTNGRFSDRAEQFCECKNVRMVGWSPSDSSLVRMVDHQALYPITVIDDMRQWELDAFAKRGYMLCREIARKDPATIARQTGMMPARAEKVVRDCRELADSSDEAR